MRSFGKLKGSREWGGGGASEAERVDPRHITAHAECTILKTGRKYTLGQCFFSELSQLIPVNLGTMITSESLLAGCIGSVRRRCVALKSPGIKRWAQP